MREPVWRSWSSGARPAMPGLAPIIGHRGAARRAPENTLAGLRRAHALGAAWVEFDVMLTRDLVPILIHDETLERTTDGHGRVPDYDLAAIQALDAGAKFAPGFAGERVPTLEEAVALLLELGLGANVEIKPALGHETATGAKVAAALAELWPADGPPLLLSSFERPALAAALHAAPHLPRGLLAQALPADWAEAMAASACTTLHLDQQAVDAGLMARLDAAGVPVLLYTVNEPARALELLGQGAAGLFTDEPDTLLAALAASSGEA